MANIKDKILKQHNIGGWGRFSLAASQIAMFVSSLTFLMVAVNAYAPVAEWLMEHGIHLPFWMFMAIVVVPIVIAYVLAWKFLVPSFYRSSTEQFWLQNNPLIKEIQDIKKILSDELPEIRKRLEALEKK